MNIIAEVVVETFNRYSHFEGCDTCQADKKAENLHEHATCKCACHERPDRRIQVVVDCGHRKEVGREIDAALPVAGEQTRCIAAECNVAAPGSTTTKRRRKVAVAEANATQLSLVD